MAAGKSTYLRNLVINATLRGQSFTPPAARYVALHYADPTEAGNQAELSGNGYARQAASFNAPRTARSPTPPRSSSHRRPGTGWS